MKDLGEITPIAMLATSRSATGTTLGRVTTTDEQRQEVLARMVASAQEARSREVTARVLWSRGDPTILTVTCALEHLSGAPVYLLDTVRETTEAGDEIVQAETARLARLTDEIEDMHERGML